MSSRLQRSYYELLDVAPDAKPEIIALGYQRALETLAQQHDTSPDARAALRQAFEVLTDPIQRKSYDLTSRPYPSAPDTAERFGDEDDSNYMRTLSARVWASAWGKALIAVLLLMGAFIWMKSGNSPSAHTPSDTAQHKPMPVVGSLVSEGPIGAGVTTKSATKSISGTATAAGPRSAEDIFSQVSLSIVRINVANADGAPVATGSGVVIGPGMVITNCHVALRGDTLEVTLGSFAYAASVEVANEERDLCLLNVSALVAPAVSLGSVDSLRVGQKVYAIGAPQGLDLTISDGIVSALREVPGGKIIQTSAPVSPGSSGGGLFDTSGRMVGVVTFQTKVGQNLNFAVPADWVGEMRSR